MAGSGQGQRDLARETLLYALAMVVSGLVQFAFLPFMSSFLTPEQAGELGVIRIISEIIAGIVVLGLPASIIRAWHQTDAHRAVLKRSILLPLFPVAVASAVVLIAGGKVSELLHITNSSLLLHALALGGSVALLQVALSMPRAKGMAGTYFTIQFIRGILSLGLLFLLLRSVNAEGAIKAFLEARWIPTSLAVIFSFFFFWRVTRSSSSVQPPKQLTGTMLAFSLPLVPASLALLVLSSADMFMLRTISTDMAQSGWYEWAGRAVLILAPLTLGFSMAWHRYIFRKKKEGGKMDELGRTGLLFMITVNWAAMVLALLSNEIVSVFGGAQWLPAAKVLPWIAGSAAMYALFTISQTAPLLTGQTKYIGWMTAFGAVVNIGFNLRLIPIAGAVGAAFATLATNMFMALSLFWLGRKVFPVSFFAVVIMVIIPVFAGPLSGMAPGHRIIAILAGTAVTVAIMQVLRSLGTGDALKPSSGGENDA
ncbi:MAG: polysaccharide biosynthesis C-terminal domain-containing protein [Candidatus Sabulitectum sp.]|nr:polysaccharide biosynthesis C-terminal domain-containing protein [Candidatus Sabulitectum sp.]